MTKKARSSLFVFLLFLLIILPLILFSPASCRSGPRWHDVSLFFFDTICDLELYCEAEEFSRSVQTVREVFTRVEDLFSPQSQDSKSPEVRDLFRLARRISIDSGGAFDLTVGVLSKLWGFPTRAYRIPTAEEIRRALGYVGMEKIKEEENGLVIPEGVILDWGGIAKGWGVDRAALALKQKGLRRGFINAGGDLICWGKNPAGGPWRIGLKHPRKSGFLGVLELENLAVATSGDYQRFFEVNGVRYHHIFDPKTGTPARGKQSVTVIGPETVICDALATAIFVLPDPELLLQLYPDYGAIVVDESGQLFFLGKKFPFTPLKG